MIAGKLLVPPWLWENTALVGIRFMIVRCNSTEPSPTKEPFPTANIPFRTFCPPTSSTSSSGIHVQMFLETKSLQKSKASPGAIWTFAWSFTLGSTFSNKDSSGWSKNHRVPSLASALASIEPPWVAGGNAGSAAFKHRTCILGTSSPV